MSTLNWRTATDITLTSELIPNPNASHILLSQLRNVQVAVEGSFLHIDPRQPHDRESAAGQEFDVYVVPAAAVKTVVYRNSAHAGNVATVA